MRTTAKFYDELSQDQRAEHVIKVCNGEACRAAGAAAVEREVAVRIGVEPGRMSNDGVRFEHVCCLGYCGRGPNGMIDGLPVSLAGVDDPAGLVGRVRRGRPHGLSEPTNHVYPPKSPQPCILMRHFDRDVTSLSGARAAGIYGSLEKAVRSMTPQQVRQEIERSQLLGRGGAGFPTGAKFNAVAEAEAEDGSGRKFVVVNGDEGDAGSYIDKELIERDPHTQLEGLLLAAYACGAQEAVIYIRAEYPRTLTVIRQAVEEARADGLIGQALYGSDFACDVRVVQGQGAYICGEETSLLRSLEGLPALVSTRPPYPAQKGLWNCPTAVNNVETLHNLSWIIAHGGEAYAGVGHGRSRGTKVVSLNTRVRRPGMYEVEMGTTLRQIIFDMASGMADGQVFKAVQVGGPLGGILPESLLDTPLDFEAMAAVNGIVGHAGIVVYSQEDDLVEIARGLMAFCAIESCGKCFPCRIGAVRGTELFDQMMDSGVTEDRMHLLGELCETMKYGSLCGMGSMTPAPIESVMEYFPEEFERYRQDAPVASAM